MDEPVRSRLRPARHRGLTRPRPGHRTAQAPAAARQHLPSERPGQAAEHVSGWKAMPGKPSRSLIRQPAHQEERQNLRGGLRLRQEMSDVFQSAIGEASLEEWERIAIRYARATRDRAAGILLGDISQDLTDLCRLIRNQRTESTARRLTRVSAQMSGLMCLVFCLLDDRQSFRKWARTASLAGNEAGDPETLSWVLAQEAYGHYYSGDITEALDVARHAYEVVHVPCTGAALSSALEARAYAVTGREVETRNALARAEEVLSHLDGDSLVPSAFGYNEASFRFHEGNAYTHLRDVKSAMRAQDRALELCAPDNYADWAMTRLDRAQCLIYAGDITGGLEYASETITTIAPAQRRGIITLRGRDIVETLPEGEKRLPAARSFQELLVASAQDSEVESP